MNLDEFQDFIIPRSNVNVDDDASFGLCGLGLAEEAGEVASATAEFNDGDILSELGDMLWYTVAACACLGVKPSNVGVPTVAIEANTKQLSVGLMLLSAQFAGHSKKVWNHKHPISKHFDDMVSILSAVLGTISLMAKSYGMSIEDIADVNVKKIRSRYPEGFRTEDSLNRVN